MSGLASDLTGLPADSLTACLDEASGEEGRGSRVMMERGGQIYGFSLSLHNPHLSDISEVRVAILKSHQPNLQRLNCQPGSLYFPAIVLN